MLLLLLLTLTPSLTQALGKYKQLADSIGNSLEPSGDHQHSLNTQNSYRSESSVSFETLAAALIIGLFALFIVVYTICLQCCWSNRRCPWFLDKEDSVKDKYTFCPCVQGIQSPDSWQSAPDLEQVAIQDWDDPLALVFVNMNVKVVVCDCGKTYKMSPELARKYYETRMSPPPTTTAVVVEKVELKQQRF